MGCQLDPRQIGDLAERQHGVVTREQLLALGLGRDAIDKRLRRGLLRPLYRGVYAVGHRALTREGPWLAAVSSQGPGAVLSHADATALWAIRRSSSPTIEVTVAARGGRRAPLPIRLHRVCSLQPQHVTIVDAIPVTTPARTLADLAPRLSPGALQRAVEECDRLKLFDLPAVREAAQGRPGCEKLAAACATADSGLLLRSGLERAFVALCREHALPKPSVNTWADSLEVDFVWRKQRLAVETDGGPYHDTPWARVRDRVRDRVLRDAGYEVVRFTDEQVETRPDEVAAALRARLA
jgi:very-short-patch-repair endonuclease